MFSTNVTSQNRWAPRALGLLGVSLLSTVLSAVNPAAAQTSSSTEGQSPISWQSCYDDIAQQTGLVYQCATVTAPLDYDRPNGATIAVALVRVPASDPTNRIGSILFNPGGPGGSGVEFILGAAPFLGLAYGPEIPQRFDLIGFDPRGIGLSTPIRCYRTFEDSLTAAHFIAFPLTKPEEAAWAAVDVNLARNCDRRAGPISQHMSTANVARDMDLIRRKLGEDSLNFVGLSYGTYLGATYANLFPGRVRSVVVDGVLDPVAWVNAKARVPFSTALRSDEGAQETLEAFFDLCEAAQPGNCAFAPNSRERFANLAAAIRAQPLTVIDPGTGESFVLTYADLIGGTLGLLYNPFAYSFLAEALAIFESQASTSGSP